MSLANTPFEPFDSNDSPSGTARQQPPAPLLSCDKVGDLIPAHAIGATDPEEVMVVNVRLAACPTATAELVNYGKLTEALLYTAPPQQAPAHLTAKVAAAVAATQIHSSTTAPIARSSTVLGRLPHKSTKPSPFTLIPTTSKPPSKPLLQRWSFARTFATAASLLLVGMNLGLMVQNQQLRSRMEQLAVELDQQTKALIFLAAEEPIEVVLPSAQENSEAQADVLWNNSLDIAVVYVRAFPTLPPDMAYQLWLRKGEQRTSAGLFTVDANGIGILVFPIEESLDGYDAMGITPEPSAGSPGPTAPAVVRRQFSN